MFWQPACLPQPLVNSPNFNAYSSQLRKVSDPKGHVSINVHHYGVNDEPLLTPVRFIGEKRHLRLNLNVLEWPCWAPPIEKQNKSRDRFIWKDDFIRGRIELAGIDLVGLNWDLDSMAHKWMSCMRRHAYSTFAKVLASLFLLSILELSSRLEQSLLEFREFIYCGRRDASPLYTH